MIKPTINVVKVTKATPTKKILMPTKNSDDDDETYNEVLHNSCIQYFLLAFAIGFVEWNPSC